MEKRSGLPPSILGLTILLLVSLLLGLAPYPRAFTAAMRQAMTHQTAGEYSAALAAYQQAAGLSPESALPWLRMGEILLHQHRPLETTAAFREALQRDGGVDALLGLGESYAQRGDWAQAISTWHHALAYAPQDPRIQLALGRGAIAQQEFQQAQDYLTQVLQLEPSTDQAASAHALLGRLLMADDPVQAAHHLRQAGDASLLAVLDVAQAEQDPTRRSLLLGAAFLQRDELILARHHFEQALSLSPGSAEAHAYLAHTLDRLGQTGRARQLLEQALELDPDSVLAYYFLGLHHRRVGHVEEAQETLWSALLRDTENAALRIAMAETFLEQSDYERAEEWYQAAVQVAPEDIEFHLLLAHFYLDHLYRVEEKGLAAATAATTLVPDDARAQDLLGWAYYLAGDADSSQETLALALSLDPGLASAHYHLGSLYASTGPKELARQHLQRAIDLDEGYYRERAEALLADLE